jgi:hypothetical protein
MTNYRSDRIPYWVVAAAFMVLYGLYAAGTAIYHEFEFETSYYDK